MTTYMDPLPRSIPDVPRFWGRVDRSGGPDGCWEWLGYRLPAGYGLVKIDGVRDLTHRQSWRLAHPGEEIPKGFYVCHRCDNPPCVNPAHLFLGEPVDNHRDMKEKGRGIGGKTHCAAGHEYTPENTTWIPRRKTGQLYRRCRECRRAASHRHYLSQKARGLR